MKEKIIVIVGPTAVGKTHLGIELAKAFNGEVINGDSMQVYKGLNIGTAKVTKEEASGIAHHLIDIKEPDETYSVSDFKKDASQKIKEITAKGKLPIIVGGTGLYIESLLYDVSHGGKAEPNLAFRKEWEEWTEKHGKSALHNQLKEKDPKAAEAIHPNNVRRVIRALEVINETGQTFSAFQAEKRKEPLFDSFVIGLSTDRKVLYERINQRVDTMMQAGLLEEAKWLYETFHNDSQSKKGIGYKEFDSYFKKETTLDESVALVKQHSRNYAKRQLTWFRNRMEIDQWVDLVAGSNQLRTVMEQARLHVESD
ncbi:tRNA (adenosine(37)-N6)-dimethylallyltransferase MiaA [Alkalibacterium iburiense]|uniref:tRNA dimethylallyltransferase n=1 Tax=Alkalibacterium iburiense TaxID=290589 RepID=A0ABN0XP68_9LACT